MKLDQAKRRLEINQEEAFALGERLCNARKTQNLPIDEVADKLLLSKQQILGLETGNLKNFYGTKLFAQAADKYAALLGFDVKPSTTLFLEDQAAFIEKSPAPIIEESLTATDNSPIEPAKKPSSRRKLVAAIATLGIISIGGFFLFEPASRIPATPVQPETARTEQAKPEQSVVAVTATPQNASEAAAKTIPAATVPQGQIILTFNNSSWVQTVETNGNRLEKIYHKSESLTLEPAKLQALIIGNAKAVDVESANGSISLRPFITSGSQVARIVGPKIRQLAK